MGCENLDPVGVVLTQFVFSQHDGIQFGSALCLAIGPRCIRATAPRLHGQTLARGTLPPKNRRHHGQQQRIDARGMAN